MGKKKKKKTIDIIDIVADVSTGLMTNEKLQKFLCGTYTNGKPRSIPDAIRGEEVSPEDKKLKIYKAMEKKKKKKKKKKQQKTSFDIHSL